MIITPAYALRDIPYKITTQYVSKVCAPSQSQVNGGTGDRNSSQESVSEWQEVTHFSIPQLNCLYEVSFLWDETSVSNAADTVIPSHHRVSLQMLNHWYHFRDLKKMLAGSRRAEQLTLLSQQCIVATVEDSVLRTEMTGLESQKEDAPKRVLFLRPMSWLGQLRPHRRDEVWSASLWHNFFSTTMGVQIPAIAEKPLAGCGCRKFQIDQLGDHLCTCTAHSGAKKGHDWAVEQIADLSQNPSSKHETGGQEPGSAMWGHRVRWLPRECSGPSVWCWTSA
jgi:hypothetical protein